MVEGPADHIEGAWTGRDSRNFLVNFTADPERVPDRLKQGGEIDLENTFVQVKITETKNYSLRGDYLAQSTRAEIAQG